MGLVYSEATEFTEIKFRGRELCLGLTSRVLSRVLGEASQFENEDIIG
jgi:hypothetical protein